MVPEGMVALQPLREKIHNGRDLFALSINELLRQLRVVNRDLPFRERDHLALVRQCLFRQREVGRRQIY